MKSIQKILCSIDLSEHSAEVAEYASLIASKLGAEVTVVYVAPTLSQYTGFKVPQSDIHAFVGEIVSGAQASMNAFVAEHFEGVKAEGEVLGGYASDEILDMLKHTASTDSMDFARGKLQMVVFRLDDDSPILDMKVAEFTAAMAAASVEAQFRIIFGSVAEKVVKNSTIPVLTIRPSK